MHQRVWHDSEEEERRAVKRFLTGQLLTGGRKMAGEPPRKSDVSLEGPRWRCGGVKRSETDEHINHRHFKLCHVVNYVSIQSS